MRQIKTAIAGLLALFAVAQAAAQTFPTIPAQTVIGRLGIPGDTGPSQAIPFATLSSRLFTGLCTASGAFPIYNATTGLWVCSTVGGNGSLAVLAGPLGVTATNPTTSATSIGFEPLSLLGGVVSNVVLSSAGVNTGTAAVYGAMENQKGGVTAGIWGAIKDSIGSENYGGLGVLEVNHASGGGAALAAFIRPNATNSIAPNATPYSGQDGINIVNELVLATTGVGNAAIGLYINSLCYPSSSISATCPAGASSDNTFVIGANIASARDEGLRIGSSSTNGYIPTMPITVYSTAGTLLWNLDNVGATHSAGYYLNQLTHDFKALWFDGTYTNISDSAGVALSSFGNASDPGNYYSNTTHTFRSRNTAVTFASLSAAGLVYTNIAAPASPAAGKDTIYTDSTDLRLHDKNSAGVIGTTVVADTGAANNFISAISAAGVITKSQPTIAGIGGLGTGVATALAANIGSAGAPVTFNGAGGTPSSLTGTNITGTAAGLTAGNVTTNANLTGAVTSVGNAASLGSFSSANLSTALTDETGSGAAMFGTSPVVTTDIRPASDGGADLGTSALRWGTLFANTHTASGQAARTWSMARNVSAATAGQNLTVQAGGAIAGTADLTSGNLILSAGIATGTAGGANATQGVIVFQGPNLGAGSSTSDNTPVTFMEAHNISGFGTLCLGSSVTCNASSYHFQGNATNAIFNTPSAGSLLFRTAGTTALTMTSTLLSAATNMAIGMTTAAWVNTAPTVASGFCTSPSITANGTAGFKITIGSGCAGSTGTLTMPTAANGWACHFADITTPASNVPYQTGGSTTSVIVTNYVRTTGVAGNFTSADVIAAECTAY